MRKDSTAYLLGLVRNISSVISTGGDGSSFLANDGTYKSPSGDVIPNQVIITDVSDFPTPSGGVITLADATIYRIAGNIDIGSNRLVMGQNTTVRGGSPAIDIITSTTTGALITSSNNFRLFELGFSAANGSIFDLNGSGSEICLCFGVRFFGGGAIGTVENYDLFEITTGLFVGYSSGLQMTGASGVTFLLLDVTFFDTQGATSIDFGTASFDIIKIANCDFTTVAGGTALDVAPNGGNLNTGATGIITGTGFNGGTATVGYDPNDLAWAVDLSNVGILQSDRLIPTGWAVYNDDSGLTQVFGGTPERLTINGGTSITSFLPKSIRGIDELWDSVTNQIKPISSGDAYIIRISFTITATTSNPTRCDVVLDIGSDDDNITIPIVERGNTLRGGNPQPISMSFNIYALDTFLANGGRIFVSANSGTITVSEPNILINRISSGNS